MDGHHLPILKDALRQIFSDLDRSFLPLQVNHCWLEFLCFALVRNPCWTLSAWRSLWPRRSWRPCRSHNIASWNTWDSRDTRWPLWTWGTRGARWSWHRPFFRSFFSLSFFPFQLILFLAPCRGFFSLAELCPCYPLWRGSQLFCTVTSPHDSLLRGCCCCRSPVGLGG